MQTCPVSTRLYMGKNESSLGDASLRLKFQWKLRETIPLGLVIYSSGTEEITAPTSI